MSAKAEAAPKAPSTTSISPISYGVLQRKCACGSSAGLSGQYAERGKRHVNGGSVQTKLAISEPGDASEQEADRVAEQVIAAPAHRDIRGTQLGIQRLTDQPTSQIDIAPASVNRALASPGNPLEPILRQDMEHRFTYDFSQVRVHSSPAAEQSARELNAHAYTVGNNIVFGAGQFAPGTPEGRRLLAHELTHVVQQSEVLRSGQLRSSQVPSHLWVQRQAAPSSAATTKRRSSTVFVPFPDRLLFGPLAAELTRRGLLPDLPEGFPLGIIYSNGYDFYDEKRILATAIEVTNLVEGKEVFVGYNVTIYGEGGAKGPATAPKAPAPSKTPSKPAPKPTAKKLGPRPPTASPELQPRPSQPYSKPLGKTEAMKEKLVSLPPEMTDLLGPAESYKPEDYQRLLRIAEKLKKFTPEDLAAYRLLTIRATDNLDLFERSVDLFIARKEELKKALAEQQRQGKKPPLKEPTAEKPKELTAAALKAMSEEERYKLAREKASEATEAQLKYMKEHPGETLKEFAKSTTLLNTPETFSAIAKDLKEAANSDANTWARWAAGTGAGAKLSGWLMAVAGVLFVASWLTGVGELATIAAGAGILLGATLSLSLVESELRINAASQATTPEEFERQYKLAGAARANVVVGVALIVVAAVLHFTAKALFPKTIQKISTSFKNLRERIRLKGSISEIQLKTRTEIGELREELANTTELAKKNAVASGEALEKLTTEQFVDRLEAGDGGFLDQSKLPPEQKFNFRELVKTTEGRGAIEGYKAKLVNALKTDVPAEIDRLAQEYGSKIDQFLKEVEAAKNHDELNAALDKAEGALTEEHAKKFMQDEQQKIVNEKLETAMEEVRAETAKAKEGKPAGPPKSPEAAEPAKPSEQEKPPPSEKPSPTQKAAEPSKKIRTREQIREQARKRLASLGEKITETQAALDKLDKTIYEANAKVKGLREKVERAPRGSEERAKALEEFTEAKEELEGLRDEQRGYMEERTRQRSAEDVVLQSLKLERPDLRQSTKEAIKAAAKKNSEGKFLDANTNEVIEGEPVYGHKYGREHRRLVLEAVDKGMTQEQFNDWVNDHPEWFQTETKANNESHRFEKPGID